MCDPVTLSLTTAALVGTAYGASRIKKDKKKTNAQIDAINKKVDDQIEADKIANSTQSTAAMQEEEDLKKKLASQKVPLNTNTGTTGLSVGNSLSTGLNLGGY